MRSRIADITTELNDINHVAVNLWYYGCTVGCRGCCNPELQQFDHGMDQDDVIEELVKRRGSADWLVHIGGNPVENPEELLRWARIGSLLSYKQYVFTGFDVEQLDAALGQRVEELSELVRFVKVGQYDEGRPRSVCPSYHFVSVNQRVVRPTPEGFVPVYYYDEANASPVGDICPES